MIKRIAIWLSASFWRVRSKIQHIQWVAGHLAHARRLAREATPRPQKIPPEFWDDPRNTMLQDPITGELFTRKPKE